MTEGSVLEAGESSDKLGHVEGLITWHIRAQANCRLTCLEAWICSQYSEEQAHAAYGARSAWLCSGARQGQ